MQNLNTFSRKFRLKGLDIREFFRTSKSEKVIINGINFYLKKNSLNHFLIAIIITRKYGISVERNKAKRIIREMFRNWKSKYLQPTDNYDIIIKLNEPINIKLLKEVFIKFLGKFSIRENPH